ncbi:hypothetical protein ACWF0M_31655 [Kribbella sp. NPDC055110]
MLPMTPTGNGVRLLVGVVPLTVLLVLFGALALIALALPTDRREYVLKLAPHIVKAVEKIAAGSAAR